MWGARPGLHQLTRCTVGTLTSVRRRVRVADGRAAGVNAAQTSAAAAAVDVSGRANENVSCGTAAMGPWVGRPAGRTLSGRDGGGTPADASNGPGGRRLGGGRAEGQIVRLRAAALEKAAAAADERCNVADARVTAGYAVPPLPHPRRQPPPAAQPCYTVIPNAVAVGTVGAPLRPKRAPSKRESDKNVPRPIIYYGVFTAETLRRCGTRPASRTSRVNGEESLMGTGVVEGRGVWLAKPP